MKPILDSAKSYLPSNVKFLYRALTGQLRLMPDFIIIGAQKCGTTSLYYDLTAHPCIAPALTKEVHFFDTNFGKGTTWYRAHFPLLLPKARRQNVITGEASPSYIFHPLAPKRISGMIPTAKIIVLLRNPVDRAYSHYQHSVRKGVETLSFEDALTHEAERLDGEREKILQDESYDSFNRRNYSYLSRGIYVDQLETWTSIFPREQLLILNSEDLYTDPQAILKQVLDFLALPARALKEYAKHNQADYPRMGARTRGRLIDYFKPYNQRLYGYLGVDFDWDE